MSVFYSGQGGCIAYTVTKLRLCQAKCFSPPCDNIPDTIALHAVISIGSMRLLQGCGSSLSDFDYTTFLYEKPHIYGHE